MKICKLCGVNKSVKEFSRRGHSKKLFTRCKPCAEKKRDKNYVSVSLDETIALREAVRKRRKYEYNKKYISTHRKKIYEYNKGYRKRFPAKVKKTWERNRVKNNIRSRIYYQKNKKKASDYYKVYYVKYRKK